MAGFVFIKQHDAMQCGAACIVILCHFYGKKYSLQQISKSLESSKGGVSMYDITWVRDKFSMKKVPTALIFPHTLAVPLACSQRSSML